MARFQRVLPLPSEKWYEDADSWFCHKPITDLSHPVNSACGVTPREGDCLVAQSHFVVCHSALAPGGAVVGTKSRRSKVVLPSVTCQRCGCTLGRQHHAGEWKRMLKLWMVSRQKNIKHYFWKSSSPYTSKQCLMFWLISFVIVARVNLHSLVAQHHCSFQLSCHT